LTVSVLLFIIGFTMYTTTVSQKGQVVIPKNIRDILNIEPNDKVGVDIENKKVIIKPVPTIDDVFGMVKTTNKELTTKEMKNIVQEEIDKKYS